MTPYGDRRRAGDYLGTIGTTKQEATVYDPASGGTTIQPPAPQAPDPAEATLKELQAEAEALGLPTYGTKAQIAERIANSDN